MDLKNSDPFKEYLYSLLKSDWRLIFTTRDNYLEDLNYLLFEIYKVLPFNINIKDLDLKQLSQISDQYHFTLPKDEKLLSLIRNPFYLNEYLKFHKENEEMDFIGFKEKIWNRTITKSKPAREQCFLKMAFERASEGQFFVRPDCEAQILDNELKSDGIVGYESPHGYFITHDIYEEWALEKIIHTEFMKKTNNVAFLANIGSSLPVRRALRNWVSEKLLLEDEKIKTFIEGVAKDNNIEPFWKDEILVSVLLSDYSERFFEYFKEELLAENQALLKKVTFLLRIACKEVDDDFFRQLGLKQLNLFSLKYVFTKPKGKGWNSLIKFVFENLDKIGNKNIHFVLPVIHDWNSKFREGETTRLAGLIALKYYEWIIKEGIYFHRDDAKDNLLQTILYSSLEIKEELKQIFENILEHKWKSHRDPYYDLSESILRKLEGYAVFNVLPEYVLKIADLLWTRAPMKNDYESGVGVEKYFCISDNHLDYFPESSYQTPTYWLLQSSLKETIDFLLSFTNKSVECFAKSRLKHEVEEVEVFIEQGTSIKQYICNRLWCMYRGTQVAPHVLGSMHMALEKFFLERGEHWDSKTLVFWLLYLLKNSKSASISAIVTSIVMAYPEKLFDVAKVIFKTKKFFLYDTTRFVLDQQQKNSLLALKTMSIAKNEIHEEERLKACDDKHRKWSLEHLFLNYQVFRSKETNENEAKKRQETLWEILDNCYKELPNESEETESDKAWRLYLARMDRRRMKPTTEETAKGFIINWNPEIEPKLKKYSDKSLEESNEPMKYMPLKLWAHYKMRNDETYKQYEQYEENPELALQEVKEIISRLNVTRTAEPRQFENVRIPAQADQSFRSKSTTDSGAFRPVIPLGSRPHFC